jgi:hypothetical protein
MAMLAALGFFVMQQAKPREEGGSLTGGGPMQQQMQQQQQQPADPPVLQLEAAVQNGRLRATKIVLEKKPEDSRALTFQGLVRMAMGDAPSVTSLLTSQAVPDWRIARLKQITQASMLTLSRKGSSGPRYCASW